MRPELTFGCCMSTGRPNLRDPSTADFRYPPIPNAPFTLPAVSTALRCHAGFYKSAPAAIRFTRAQHLANAIPSNLPSYFRPLTRSYKLIVNEWYRLDRPGSSQNVPTGHQTPAWAAIPDTAAPEQQGISAHGSFSSHAMSSFLPGRCHRSATGSTPI